MTTSDPTPREDLRALIREIVRDVLREVISEEVAAAMHGGTQNIDRRTDGTRHVALRGHHYLKGALTERHIRAAESEQATITVTRRVVITPLARERAKTSGIEIIRIEE